MAALAGARRPRPGCSSPPALGFVAASIDVWRRQRALFTFTLALGVLCWPSATPRGRSVRPVHEIVAWWLAFLILTIAGERLELSRFMPPSPVATRLFARFWSSSQRVSPARAGPGAAWSSAPACSRCRCGWQAGHRPAHGARQGPDAFHRGRLLSGYVWLAVGGAVIVGAGGLAAGTPAYDAALHALALGFVFSMVFGHAPIIFPAVLRIRVPYHPSFYVPLALLHGRCWCAWPATRRAIRLGARGRPRKRGRTRGVHREHSNARPPWPKYRRLTCG